jgi:VWFA-related protein
MQTGPGRWRRLFRQGNYSPDSVTPDGLFSIEGNNGLTSEAKYESNGLRILRMRLHPIAAALALAGLVTTAFTQAAPAQLQSAPQVVLNAQAYAVLLDVVVTEDGKRVTGLDRKRFHILEDGKEQAISFLEEHAPEKMPPAAKHPPLPPHYFNNLPSRPPGSAVNVLLLDALNTPLGNQLDVRRQMVKYLGTIEPGTTMAIFTLSTRLRMIQGFTSNAGELMAALKNAKANPQQSVSLDSPSGGAFDSAVSNLQLMGSSAAASVQMTQQFQDATDTSRTDQRVELTLEAMQQLARYLSAVPGRKNLIWFSGAFPLALGPTSIANPAAGSSSYQDQVRSTVEMLATARVAVYPMDAAGLAIPAVFDAANSGLGGVQPGGASRNSFQASDVHFTMEEIADQTGGMALFNHNDFARAVASAVENGSNYYTIGYVPESRSFHGEFRKFKVRLDDCHCELAYRRGYYADPPGKRSRVSLTEVSLITTATLHGAPPSSQVLFQTRVLPATDPVFKDAKLAEGPAGDSASSLKAPLYRFVVDVVVDPKTLTFDTATDGRRQGALEFALVAYDADGKRVNYMDRTLQMALSPDEYAHMATKGVPIRMELDFPAGQDFLTIAVHDRIGVRVGSLEIPLTVPAN